MTKLLTLTLALTITSAVSAQLERWVLRPNTPARVDAKSAYPQRVIVKFVEGIRVRLRDHRLVCMGGSDIAAVIDAIGKSRIERLFSRAEPDLDTERANLQARVPANEPPLADLNNYFRVITRNATASEHLIDALLKSEQIETAYAEFRPVMMDDIPPTTPDFTSQQTYLGPAPTGYSFTSIQSIVGARGQGLQLAHLESSWHFGHEDIDGLATQNLIGQLPSSRWDSWKNHGTACVGLMAAGRNGYGVTGMGSDADALFVSSQENGVANMISLACARLQAGDVMSSSFGFFTASGAGTPLDYAQAPFDAVRTASMKGIHYTLAAGNTAADLGDARIFGSRYLPTSPSSGGFIISGSDAGTLNPTGFTYGDRVDANAWGRQVTTTGYGSLFDPGDPRQRYTATFAGTSAAAPAVAGVIAALVGSIKEQNGIILTNAHVRQVLKSTGTLIRGNIGNRPNLVEALALFGLPDGLLVLNEPVVGSSLDYVVAGDSGKAFGVLLAFARGRVSIGANRPLLLDQGLLLTLSSSVFPATGAQFLSVQVPNAPALKNLVVYMQAVRFLSGRINLTNSVMGWVR